MKAALLALAVSLVLTTFSTGGRVSAGGSFGAVATGGGHSCAVTTSGGVKCWGENDNGQLGDGTTSASTSPVSVVGLSSGVAGIAADASTTCAVTTAGAVKCWGSNSQGQVGADTTQMCGMAPLFVPCSSTPLTVSGLSSGVAAVTVGALHACALMRDGGVKCWGYNHYGQLGTGTNGNSQTPVDVVGLSEGATAIAASSFFTCALTTAGGVKCWGDNAYGQLGDGTDEERNAPVEVVDLATGVRAIGVGGGDSLGHACAAMISGGVKCWGNNEYGQLGDNRATCHSPVVCSAPIDVLDITTQVSQITGGLLFTCAVTNAGLLKCWGRNEFGQLGDSMMCGSLCGRPVNVANHVAAASAIAAGQHHACAAVGTGNVICWGDNLEGEAGDGGVCGNICPEPVLVIGFGGAANGDVNCDQAVNSIDAALVLQFGAGLVTSLPCLSVADANHDGHTNSIDSALILQFSAGLVAALP